MHFFQLELHDCALTFAKISYEQLEQSVNSAKQKFTRDSAAETEYVPTSGNSSETVWYKRFLLHLGDVTDC